MTRFIRFASVSAALAIGVLAIVGCDSSQPPAIVQPESEPRPAQRANEETHGHLPGQHGGILVPLGRDSYHAEAVFEKNGTIRLYMLGKDEARVQEVEVQDLAAYLTAAGSAESVSMTFRPEPQAGDTKGKTSLFVGTVPMELKGRSMQVTVNNIRVNGERFRISFSNERKSDHVAEMPLKKGTDAEQKLFLTPGGLYTQEDIEANGNTMPTVKYRGIRASHDDNPKKGEKICPISKTKANPKFTWIIGGKTYEFCCIPCIEEFVVLAKEKPGDVKNPEDYVKQ